MSANLTKSTHWIWHRQAVTTDHQSILNDEIYCFRRTFTVKAPAQTRLIARISADSRYRLFLNGKCVSLGPCKGDTWHTYFETVDLTPHLKAGKNVLAARVVHIAPRRPFNVRTDGPNSIVRTSQGAFLFDGRLATPDGTLTEDLSTGTSPWHWRFDNRTRFIPTTHSMFATFGEHIQGEEALRDWTAPDFDDADWALALPLAQALFPPDNVSDYGEESGWILYERPIPPLDEIPRKFIGVKRSESDLGPDTFMALLDGKSPLSIAPRTRHIFEIDAGELTTGYLTLGVDGGANSKIRLVYSECYEQMEEGKYVKRRRDDESGHLRGDHDIFEPIGGEETFEPFFFRTFRFIRVEIDTADQPLHVHRLDYRETGYPLPIDGRYESSDPMQARLWDISIRTLKRCMHETYEDCPYYEQLQYAMDTRLQALFAAQLSPDDRLRQRAVHDFHSSMTPDGLLQARFPSQRRQIIPGFSLHWIFMVEDTYQFSGDIERIKRYRPTIDAILDWFDRRREESGLVGRTGNWSFVDWVAGWDCTSVPPAHRDGPMTVYNMMVVYTLEIAARLCRESGRPGLADEYRQRAQAMRDAIRAHCWDDQRGLFRDGPTHDDFSQHAQVWAVLADVVQGDEARALMERTLREPMSQVSYAMAFYLFRALEKTGLYGRTRDLWPIWEDLAKLNLTTWVEDPVTQRSECHGWGSLPLYEYPAMILGVKPAQPGYRSIRVKPHPIADLTHAQGAVSTPHGPVDIQWRRGGDQLELEVTGPAGIPVTLEAPNGYQAESQPAAQQPADRTLKAVYILKG